MNHYDLVKLSQHLDIPTRAGGLCYGYSSHLLFHTLEGKVDVFIESLELCALVYSELLNGKSIAHFDKTVLLNVYQFLTTISFHLQPNTLDGNSTSSSEFSFLQDILLSMPLVNNGLHQQGGLVKLESISGLYSVTLNDRDNELYLFFSSLKNVLQDVICQSNFSMLLSNHDHTFQLGFDAKKGVWILGDANPAPDSDNTKIYEIDFYDIGNLTQRVIAALKDPNSSLEPSIAMCCEVFTTATHFNEVQRLITAWQATPDYLGIHQVTPIKAQKFDCNNYPWLAHAIHKLDYGLVKSLLESGAQLVHCPAWALAIPIFKNDYALIELMLEYFPIYQIKVKEDNLLFLSVRQEKREIVNLFFKFGANVDSLSAGFSLEQVANPTGEVIKIIEYQRLHQKKQKLQSFINTTLSLPLKDCNFDLILQEVDQVSLIKEFNNSKQGRLVLKEYFKWLKVKFEANNIDDSNAILRPLLLIFQIKLETPLSKLSSFKNSSQCNIAIKKLIDLLNDEYDDITFTPEEISALKDSKLGNVLVNVIPELPVDNYNSVYQP